MLLKIVAAWGQDKACERIRIKLARATGLTGPDKFEKDSAQALASKMPQKKAKSGLFTNKFLFFVLMYGPFEDSPNCETCR